MTKSDIFIADAHITGSDTDCARRLTAFLDEIKRSTRTLYILGDLFDFWFGDNKASFTVFRPILDKLKELTEHSVKIVYVEGNHDFQMGRFFTDVLGAKVCPRDATIEIDKKRCYMTHGDTIDYNDKLHLISRLLLRSPIFVILKKVLPEGPALAIAKKLSSASRNKSLHKKALDDALLLEYVTDKKGKGIDTVIFAHTHDRMIEEIGGCLCVNPGAFADGGSYLHYQAGIFTLKNFTR